MTMRPKLLEYGEMLKGFRRTLGETDMRPLFYVEYEGDLVVTVFAGVKGKAEMLDALVLCGAGMDASALTLAFDAKFHHAEVPLEDADGEMLNPVTGKPWQQGELVALAEDGAGEALGIVDALALVRIERGSDEVEGLSLPYRVAAGTVDYLPTAWADDELAHNMEGTFADALRVAMNRPTLGSVVAENPFAQLVLAEEGLSDEERATHQRCVVLKHLFARGIPVMIEPRNEAEVEVYCRSLDVTREDFERGRTVLRG